jgi:hypothetical protein
MGAEMKANKINLWAEAQQFHQKFWRHLKMTSADRNMLCAYSSDVEEILTFKILKVLKSKLHVRRLSNK